MSDLQGWFIVGFLCGFFAGSVFYMIKSLIIQFKEIHRLDNEIKKIS